MTVPQVLERDYDDLPVGRDGRRPELRPSDQVNFAGQETGRHTLSQTRVGVWLGCHRKFELNYLKRLELVRRPRYFTLGAAFQKAIEYQDPEVGVRLLNGFEPCPDCDDGMEKTERTLLSGELCLTCDGRRYIGEQLHFHYESDETEHRINEAIVRGAATLYLKKWPGGAGETREVEYRVRLRSPWTGAYSNTYDLLGYADGVIDRPMAADSPMTDEPPLEVIENKLVGRIERTQVLSLPLDRQLALERYGLWRATGRPVTRVWYRYIKKPSIQQVAKPTRATPRRWTSTSSVSKPTTPTAPSSTRTRRTRRSLRRAICCASRPTCGRSPSRSGRRRAAAATGAGVPSIATRATAQTTVDARSCRSAGAILTP
jgi:hypothetical protein